MKLTNLLAFFHVVILGAIIYFIQQNNQEAAVIAILLLVLSTITDIIMRYTSHGKQKFKSFLHPFSDKLIVLVLILLFTLRGLFPVYFLVLFAVRDLIVGYIRMRASRDYVELSGDIYGKTITLAQLILVFILLAGNYFLLAGLINSAWATASLFALYFCTLLALILGIASVIYYIAAYSKGLKKKIEIGKEIKQEKIVVLANKKSGGYKEKYRRRLLRKFSQRRKAKIYYLPKSGEMFKDINDKIKDAGQVVIAGGDGSFESALNNKTLKKKTLGFFPMGAGNSFYSYFYKGKRFEYLRSRFHFYEVDLDVIELEWEKGKTQTLFLSLGIDAEVMKHSSKDKRHNFAAYWSAGTATAFGPRISYNLNCNVDGKIYQLKNCSNFILGKVPYIGFGLRSLLGRVIPNSGKIHGLAVVNTHGKIWNKTLRLWVMLLSQLGILAAPLVAFKGKTFKINSEKPFSLQAGGEFLGYTKWIKLKVVRKQKVLMI